MIKLNIFKKNVKYGKINKEVINLANNFVHLNVHTEYSLLNNYNPIGKLIDKAKEAGVDCIKFQTFKTEKVISKNTEMASYQKENLQNEDTQYEMVKKLELSYENFKDLKNYCQKVGIQFLSTPDEEESLDFLVNELQMDTIKVGSGELTNYPYLKKIALKNKDIIISTGMSNLSEIERA